MSRKRQLESLEEKALDWPRYLGTEAELDGEGHRSVDALAPSKLGYHRLCSMA